MPYIDELTALEYDVPVGNYSYPALQQMQQQQAIKQQQENQGMGMITNSLKGIATNYAKKKALGALGESAVSSGSEAVGSALTAEGLPGVLMSDGTIVAAGAETGGLAGLGSAASAAAPIAALIGAALIGRQGYRLGKDQSPTKVLTDPKNYLNPLTLQTKLLGALMGSQTKQEEGRWGDLSKKLIEQGMPEELLPNAGVERTNQNRQQQFEEILKGNPDIAPDFTGFLNEGSPDQKWANLKFMQSGNESDLKAEDTWGYANWGREFGPSYYGTSEDIRRQINEAALAKGLLNEHHGTLDFTGDTTDFQNWANERLGQSKLSDADRARLITEGYTGI